MWGRTLLTSAFLGGLASSVFAAVRAFLELLPRAGIAYDLWNIVSMARLCYTA